MVFQQFPNSFGRPDCSLTAPYTAGSGVMHVDHCPIDVLLTGPIFQVKLGSSLYRVTDIRAYPHQVWTVVGNVESTTDFDHVSGTAVYLELTREAVDSIRARSFVTFVDETANGYPNSVPLDNITLAELASAFHRDLSDIDPNQHHRQFHDHTLDLDGQNLFPNILFAQQQFAMSGAITPPQLTGNVDDYQPDGGDDASIWCLASSATWNITGIAYTEVWGFIHIFVNKGVHDIVFKHADAGSRPDHQFFLAGGTDFTLGPNRSVMAWYDVDDQRIRLLV